MDPRPEDFPIDVISLGLSATGRFAGQIVPVFYSVAEHSVHCAQMAKADGYPPIIQLEALMHDATELVVGDVPRPVKRHLPQLQEMEERVWRLGIAPAYGLPEQICNEVHIIDNRMLVTEAAAMCFRGEGLAEWWNDDHWPPPYDPAIIKCWPSVVACRAFLGEYRRIKHELTH